MCFWSRDSGKQLPCLRHPSGHVVCLDAEPLANLPAGIALSQKPDGLKALCSDAFAEDAAGLSGFCLAFGASGMSFLIHRRYLLLVLYSYTPIENEKSRKTAKKTAQNQALE